MMGWQNDGQVKLFYEFCLEDRVPANHLLRKIDRLLDLSDLRRELAPFYSSTGRPSIDPELMIRMLVVGYCFGIRSERRLCEEVDLNLAYRWFCRLGLEGRVPNHSTFSKTRHGRFRDSGVFRHVFEAVVHRAIAEGLVGGEGFAVDASLIAADANKQRAVPNSDDVDWQALAKTRRSVREYLDTLDNAAWGAASEVVPKFISKSDPAAQWTGAHKGHAFFAYADNYLIDLKAAIIVDVEATRAIRQAEIGAAKTMIDRTEARFGLKPRRLSGDSAYGAAEILGWMVEERNIEPHVALWDKSERTDGTFSRSEFIFDATANAYTCPGGKLLRKYSRPFAKPRTGITKDNTLIYNASQHDCAACGLKARCCPGQPGVRSREASMKRRAMSSATSETRQLICNPGASGRRSRCSSLISSVSSSSTACGCAVPLVHGTSSCSPPSLRTLGNWPKWASPSTTRFRWQHRKQKEEPATG
jgi:transposase